MLCQYFHNQDESIVDVPIVRGIPMRIRRNKLNTGLP